MKSPKEVGGAYEKLCQELSRILYEEDPAGIGRTIAAPDDEYDAQAGRLAVALKDCTSQEEIERVVQEMFRKESMALVHRVEKALTKFRWRAGI